MWDFQDVVLSVLKAGQSWLNWNGWSSFWEGFLDPVCATYELGDLGDVCLQSLSFVICNVGDDASAVSSS